MRKTLILSTFLLLCVVWAGAQTSPSSSSPSSATQPTSSSSMSQSSSDSSQTLQGCLGGSAGNFTLTSSSGTTYQLAGDTSKLSDHVGEQVEITGSASSSSTSSGSTGAGSSASGTNPSSSSSSPSARASGSMSGGQTINVQKVKKIASSCSTR